MRDKADLVEEVRRMLGDVFTAQASGEVYPRLARAHGYVDGYMRALLDLGIVSKSELVDLVQAERERSSPAIRTRDSLVDHAAA